MGVFPKAHILIIITENVIARFYYTAVKNAHSMDKTLLKEQFLLNGDFAPLQFVVSRFNCSAGFTICTDKRKKVYDAIFHNSCYPNACEANMWHQPSVAGI